MTVVIGILFWVVVVVVSDYTTVSVRIMRDIVREVLIILEIGIAGIGIPVIISIIVLIEMTFFMRLFWFECDDVIL